MTNDLALEYDPKDISFQVQLPYFVVSNMSKIKNASLTVPSAETYAYYAVKNIGYSGQISPYPIHAVMLFFLNFVPNILLEKYINSLHLKIREKAMKKFNAEKSD